jgi:hypothetical protein
MQLVWVHNLQVVRGYQRDAVPIFQLGKTGRDFFNARLPAPKEVVFLLKQKLGMRIVPRHVGASDDVVLCDDQKFHKTDNGKAGYHMRLPVYVTN